MTESLPKADPQAELDLAAILRELYRRKWFIMAFTLLVGILVAGYSLTLNNVYSSSAALIVRAPESPIAGEAQPLSVETLKILTESTEVKWLVFERLWSSQALEKWRDQSLDKQGQFMGFQGSLETVILQQESKGAGGAVALLPVLILKAKAGSPAEAQVVTNTWVDVVTERSHTIYTQGVGELDVFMADVFERADNNLVEQELEITQKTLEADVDIKDARFNKIRSKAIELEADMIDLDVTLQTTNFMMAEIEKRLAEREFDGQWLGNAAQDLILAGKREELDLENPSPAAIRILEQVQAILDMNDELMELVTTSNLDSKKSETDSLQTLLNSTNTTIAEKRLNLLKQTLALENLQTRLAEQEVEGVWVGELLDEYYRATLNPLADPEFVQALSKPEITEQTQRLDQLLSDLVARQYALLDYLRETDLEFKILQVGLFEAELKDVLVAREQAAKTLTTTETRLAFLKPELERQPEKLTLDKAITDDALWQEYLLGSRGESAPGTALLTPLKTEMLNPAHQKVYDQVIDLTAQTAALKEEIGMLEARETSLRGNIDTLRREIALIEMEVENRKAGIATREQSLEVLETAYRTDKQAIETALLEKRQAEEEIRILEAGRDEVHEQYRNVTAEVAQITQRIAAKTSFLDSLRDRLEIMASDYQAQQKELEGLRLQQVRDEAMKTLKERLLAESTQESEELQQALAVTQHDLDMASRDLAKLTGIRETLATRAEEVALLKVSAQNASRSGTTVLYRAEVNPAKEGPARSRMVLGGMMGAFVLSCMLTVASLAIRTP